MALNEQFKSNVAECFIAVSLRDFISILKFAQHKSRKPLQTEKSYDEDIE